MTEATARPMQVRVPIRESADVAIARMRARELGLQQGFGESATEAIATAVSEIAHNIIVHASAGEVTFGVCRERARRGIVVVARDDGPGIRDLDRAMQDGYSTANGLGLGLSGARRLMDAFELVSVPGEGTTVTMKKWAS